MIYKSEIERIWKAQFDSLSRKDEPQLTDEDEKKDLKKTQRPLSLRENAPYVPVMPLIAAGPSGPASPAFSRGSSLDRDRDMSVGPDGSRKVLRIKRLVRLGT